MALTLADTLVLILYLALTLGFGLMSWRKSTLLVFLFNNRATGLGMMTAATVSTVVGAGAIVGVSGEAMRTGISYPILTAIVLTVNAAMFIALAGRIRKSCEALGCFTISELLEKKFGAAVGRGFACAYLAVALAWTAVQVLALAHLLGALLGVGLGTGIALGLAVTVSYSALGGIRSDIRTDALQFVVMLIAFAVLVPRLFISSGGAAALKALPPGHFDATAFGGLSLLIGSVVIGGLYPLSNVHDWLRVNSVVSDRACRTAYIISQPLIVLFLGAAALCGLIGAANFADVPPDRVLFHIFSHSLPAGLRGLAFAGMVAVVMSSVDSLLIGAAANTARAFFSSPGGTDPHQSKKRIQATMLGFAALSALTAYGYPRIVDLSLLATYVSLCCSPAILAALLNWRVNSTAAVCSLYAGLIVQISSYHWLGPHSGFLAFGLACVLLFFPVRKCLFWLGGG